jgi:thymidylate synthase
MRSQSTIGVLPYDVFLFASLQCIAAAELGVGPGDYIHVSGSLHAYEDELELLTLAANDAFSCRRLSSLPALATMTELTILESQLRMAVESRRSREVERIWDNVSYEPGSFAYEVTALLAATALDRVGLPEHAAEVMKHSGPFASS